MSIPTTPSTPATPGTPDDSLATSAPHSPATQAPALPEPVYLDGPAPFAVTLGLLGLLFAVNDAVHAADGRRRAVD
jgi:hypothetical protein